MFFVPFLLAAVLAQEDVIYAPVLRIAQKPIVENADYSTIPKGSMLRIGYVSMRCDTLIPYFDGVPEYTLESRRSIFDAAKIDYDVFLLFGGYQDENINEPAVCIKDVSELVRVYKDIIERLGVNQIEFKYGNGPLIDNSESFERRTLAIAILKAQIPRLKVAISLPTIQSNLRFGQEIWYGGFVPDALKVLQFSKKSGVNYEHIHLQIGGEVYREGFKVNIENAINQIKQLKMRSKVGLTAALNLNAPYPLQTSKLLLTYAVNHLEIFCLGMDDLYQEKKFRDMHEVILLGGLSLHKIE
jgi:hypothetical protein